MSHQTLISSPFGSSARAFFQSAGFCTALLILLFMFNGDFNQSSLKWLIFPFFFVPMAGGVAGLIFKNTTGLRHAEGSKKILGWAIGILGYLILVPMALILGLNDPN